MSHPNQSASDRKPIKPRDDFPLSPRADGRWMKRVYGKVRIFKGTADEALAAYEALLIELEAGDTGQQQIRHLCERFMCAKEQALNDGHLHPRTFREYNKACDVIVAHFGRLRPLDSLTRKDAEQLRARLTKGVSVKTQEGRINRTRIIFKYGHDQELLPRAFHVWIATIDARVLKKYQGKQPPRTMTAAELRQLIDAAPAWLKAAALLGINAAYGNSDIAELTTPWLDLDGGWLSMPRVKTGETRRARLWPETVEALRLVLSQRRAPADPAYADHVFLTRQGNLWVRRDGKKDALAPEFRRLATKVGIKRPGMSFYTLRHCFETISGDACDQVATNLVMGHADPSMAANYRHGIKDERLVLIADHVHRWLYGKPMGKGKRGLRVVG